MWFANFHVNKPCFRLDYRCIYYRESEKKQREWKHTIGPLPKNGFGPPTYDTFPPPVVHTLSFSLEEPGIDQANPTF